MKFKMGNTRWEIRKMKVGRKFNYYIVKNGRSWKNENGAYPVFAFVLTAKEAIIDSYKVKK
jgi:hypothetical protein